MIVVDASAVVEVLLQNAKADIAEQWLLNPQRSKHAPHLLDMEVAHSIRRYATAGLIDAELGRAALGNLLAFSIRRYPHQALLPRIWDLRHNMSAYDAAYVALAELLEAPLLTFDARLASAARRHVGIEVL